MDNRQRILDWQPRFDERSRLFAAVAGIENEPLISKHWDCSAWLDQGREGACVGFGWSHELCAEPDVDTVDNNFALSVYHRAQQLDEFPGEDYSGTSVLAGVKATMELTQGMGLTPYSSYRWAFGVEDIMRTIAYKGPVVLGITWYENMYDPDENNFVHASGPVAGGHCILANGVTVVKVDPNGPDTYDNVDPNLSYITLHNSWGQSWGNNGEGFVTVADLKILIEDQKGEACVPERSAV